jgi:2-methylisocitrate lyase-like PEP mutase family enzyme
VDIESGFSDDPDEVADLACQLSAEGVVGTEAGAARISTGSLLFRKALRSAIQTAHDARTGAVTAVPDRPTYAQIQASIVSR